MRLKWGEAIDQEKFNYRLGEAMMEQDERKAGVDSGLQQTK